MVCSTKLADCTLHSTAVLVPVHLLQRKKCFETDVIKFQANRNCGLTYGERSSGGEAALDDTPNFQLSLKHNGSMLMAQKVLKKAHSQETLTSTKWLDLCYFLATFNKHEHHISEASYVLVYNRFNISLANFVCQPYLHAKSVYWSSADVHKLLV